MHEEGIDLDGLLWFAGWLAALLVLFAAGLLLPLQTHLGRVGTRLQAGACVVAAIGIWVLANVALTLHDTHIDVTREKVFTPAPAAMRVVDELRTPVTITWFYRAQDAVGRRTGDLLKVMARRNALLTVAVVDPDTQPEIARRQGIRLYNAAVIEAEGRRVLVQGTDEAEIALGIQRALRERTVGVCFLEGHGEFAMDGFEYHTHLDGIADHNHGEASSKIIDTAGHGVGRLRRVLEAQGYEARKLVLATRPDVPADCSILIAANPRTTFLPGESAALRAYLARGGAALLLFDLGFVLEPGLERLVADLGVHLEQESVVDPLSHYQSDAEMVAVTGYDPHPVTRSVSLTFYPGIRPLTLGAPAAGVTVVPLLRSSRDSYTRPVAPADIRAVLPAATVAGRVPQAGPRVLGIAAEGRFGAAGQPFRAILVGDGDFASNSFLPYMANSDLLLAMVRWLAREEQGTAVRPRIPVPPMILLSAADARTVFVGVVLLLPLAVVLLGCIVWWRRR